MGGGGEERRERGGQRGLGKIDGWKMNNLLTHTCIYSSQSACSSADGVEAGGECCRGEAAKA